ncbi:MAG: murein L,D-transpeptidase catalytic domain family protein, partial [Bacteroidota bacterium]|nr:murein L,D-transpeptidase catalytic domain family protein [Bacteroidota bacterium]
MSLQKKYIIFLMAAHIAAVPVLAQANYASLKITSPAGREKKFAVNFPDYFSALKPFADPFHRASATSHPSSPRRKKNIRKEKTHYNVRGANKNKASVAIKRNETIPKNIDISFKPTSFTYTENSKADIGLDQFPGTQLILYAKALKQYALKNGYDTSYAFLSNMGMLCNRKRFFVVNLVTMEIEQSGLVSHGRGQGPSLYDKQYSNQAGSKCTSLGRYKIWGKYKGNYGESYRMIGLDSSNQNALSRNIVLHSMACIPDTDGVAPACVSDGCPAVSTNFLSSLSKMIDSRKKPLLLWIFDSNLEEAVVENQPATDGQGP